MPSQKNHKRRWSPLVLFSPLLIAFLLLLMPLILLSLAVSFLYGLLLQLIIWLTWRGGGVNVLLVYSDSPNWQEYIETNIIPRLPPTTVVLNWSQRRNWRWWSLTVRAFRYFGGQHEFNPLVVVFRPFRWARNYRFFKAFKDFKRGNIAPLEALEKKLFDQLGRHGAETPA